MKLTYILIPIIIFLIIYLLIVNKIQYSKIISNNDKNNEHMINDMNNKLSYENENNYQINDLKVNEPTITNESIKQSIDLKINELPIANESIKSSIDVKLDDTCKTDTNEKCDAKTCGIENLHPILDPKFNMRETSKQCLLLEDHLNNKKKRCFDCIRKHFLTVDALLEEAVSLEKDNVEREYYRNLHLDWIKIEKKYASNSTDPNNIDNISKQVRIFRKPLVEMYFDTISEYSE